MSVRNLVRRVFNVGTARADHIIDEAERSARQAEQRAREAGRTEHDVAAEANNAYHGRRHELLSRTRGVTDASLAARADERDTASRTPEELAELAEIEAWLDEQEARRERELDEEFAEADEQRIRELQGKAELSELDDRELDDLLVDRCERSAAQDAVNEAERELGR